MKVHIIDFKEIRYRTLLLISILLFFGCYLLDILIEPRETGFIFILVYFTAILLAASWAILNYIDNLRINPLYKNYHTIATFVASLTVSKDEREEVEQLMSDYVEDQVQNGAERETAEKEIIEQFRTSELQHNPAFFYIHSFNYLIKLGILFIVIGLILALIDLVMADAHTPAIDALEITLIGFGFGFWLTFALYRLLNQILMKK
ncbi:hypothetical protein [Enterococcus xiangfangensis]|uniref:hypothetical protein n=1 Tax=Enterococcus xiangfangensis TaxID=1296537 RepID=UPI003D1736A2|nr:hypothetical protein [Enterococcus asini]